MADPEKNVLRCSFCNKAQRNVKKLIAGPRVYICDECVDICNGILEEDDIPAGRGVRAARRTGAQADEYLKMSADLIGAGNFVGAAREARNAALAALRGLALLDGDSATQWSETKVVVTAMEENKDITELLQVDDRAHILLRVSIDGARLTAADVESAIRVTEKTVTLVREKADAKMTARTKTDASA